MRLHERLKELFIPCEGNGFRPNFLERFSVALMLMLVLLSFTMANIQALLWIGSDWMVSTILPAVIVDLTNQERDSGSLGELKRSTLLDKAAQLKADDMAKNSYFAHYSPTGVSPWHWFDQVSYDFVYAGENLAVHFTDSRDVVDAWMQSPSHKANIMNGTYTEIGVGTAKGEYKGFPTIFVVQLFGTPAVHAAQTEPAVAGSSAKTNDGITVESITFTEPQDTQSSSSEVAPARIVRTEPITSSLTDNKDPLTGEETTVVADNAGSSGSDIAVVNEPAESQETIVLYSDLATTSRPGVPAVTEPTKQEETQKHTNVLERSVTQPGLWLQVLYGLLATVVIIALILSIVIEWRKQHPIQIAYAGGLLAIMALLFHIHAALTSGVTII